MELLEYLGYWEESDEDWVMIDRRLESDEEAGSGSEESEPAENEDES